MSSTESRGLTTDIAGTAAARRQARRLHRLGADGAVPASICSPTPPTTISTFTLILRRPNSRRLGGTVCARLPDAVAGRARDGPTPSGHRFHHRSQLRSGPRSLPGTIAGRNALAWRRGGTAGGDRDRRRRTAEGAGSRSKWRARSVRRWSQMPWCACTRSRTRRWGWWGVCLPGGWWGRLPPLPACACQGFGASAASLGVLAGRLPGRRGQGRGPRESEDLAGVEAVVGVGAVEQGTEHLGAGGGDVLLQPLGVLGPDGVMVRERGAVVDERLLDGRLDDVVLDEHVLARAGAEGKREVQARAPTDSCETGGTSGTPCTPRDPKAPRAAVVTAS